MEVVHLEYPKEFSTINASCTLALGSIQQARRSCAGARWCGRERFHLLNRPSAAEHPEALSHSVFGCRVSRRWNGTQECFSTRRVNGIRLNNKRNSIVRLETVTFPPTVAEKEPWHPRSCGFQSDVRRTDIPLMMNYQTCPLYIKWRIPSTN